MKKYILNAIIAISILLTGCKEDKHDNIIRFAISADYPPFEYYENGKFTGFDIELAQLVAKELGKEAIFKDMQFSTIFAALQSNSVDAAISTIGSTEEREKNFDFSNSYYTGEFGILYHKNKPIAGINNLTHKKIAVQLGTVMEIWLKEHVPTTAQIIAIDNNNQAVETLKSGHVDGVLIGEFQGKVFSKKNPGLSWSAIAKSDNGYSIAVNKGSDLKDKINEALKSLESKGVIQKIAEKWLGDN
ncbi:MULTISPECIES: substrate-binding periplasmic protein [Wolbachia]|uniref:substrate-binding periplasmic protein n=2 Tax=Wolbachieae TaxID=952 RepID=UPI0015FB7490|nr:MULTISPECIES: ABC transporter substrate-binding protein [Wolbachia]MBA8756957.1 amino acid ABC transporter substrate-binding protein [Wolbachia pipientis]MDE5058884.1 ABC transporter substrate-binding protein [Wolbachia endosymbiont of Drosophila baimaii]